MAYANETGSKRAAWYSANATTYMPSKDCKAALLADLKKATKNKASALHGCRVTLREPHHASYRVTISDAPFAIFTTEDHREAATHRGHYEVDAFKGAAVLFYSKRALQALAEVNALATEWNYDRSDIQTDYFDVGFYFDAEFNYEQRRVEQVAMMAAGGGGQARQAKAIEQAREVLNDHLAGKGAELVEASWNLRDVVVKATRKEFGDVAADQLYREIEAAKVDAESFDKVAAQNAGGQIVLDRKAGLRTTDKAKSINAANKRKAKKAAKLEAIGAEALAQLDAVALSEMGEVA